MGRTSQKDARFCDKMLEYIKYNFMPRNKSAAMRIAAPDRHIRRGSVILTDGIFKAQTWLWELGCSRVRPKVLYDIYFGALK